MGHSKDFVGKDDVLLMATSPQKMSSDKKDENDGRWHTPIIRPDTCESQPLWTCRSRILRYIIVSIIHRIASPFLQCAKIHYDEQLETIDGLLNGFVVCCHLERRSLRGAVTGCYAVHEGCHNIPSDQVIHDRRVTPDAGG